MIGIRGGGTGGGKRTQGDSGTQERTRKFEKFAIPGLPRGQPQSTREVLKICNTRPQGYIGVNFSLSAAIDNVESI